MSGTRQVDISSIKLMHNLDNKTKYDSSKSQTSRSNRASFRVTYGDGSYASGHFINDVVKVYMINT